ncbi:hypothetical protein [uncultured Sphingomonas sp.]|uniref:hypothetical protein n=1 Tax=uncultured Sphingomonas sp. TaxID=158754 RepID=UPI0035CC5A91
MQLEELAGIVAGVAARLPEWVRTDLASKDASARERAEETLAAMIVAATSVSSVAEEHAPD